MKPLKHPKRHKTVLASEIIPPDMLHQAAKDVLKIFTYIIRSVKKLPDDDLATVFTVKSVEEAMMVLSALYVYQSRARHKMDPLRYNQIHTLRSAAVILTQFLYVDAIRKRIDQQTNP